MRVVIAVDATRRRAEAVRQAASRSWPEGTVFLLLYILDPFPFAETPMFLAAAEAAASAQLKVFAEELDAQGWKTETQVLVGRPRQAIAAAANSWKADMLMVGSNQTGALARLVLGSTARSVLREATCPVEIVRPLPRKAAPARGTRILVATDGSEFSTAALRFVAGRPWPKGSEARVISIPEPFVPLSQFPPFESKEIENLNISALKSANQYVTAGAEILSKAGLEATTEVPFPEHKNAKEIIQEARRWRANIIVLGSHGRRGFDRMRLGSVSESVAMHAPCSVEVIPPGVAKGSTKDIGKKGAKP